MNRKLIAIVLLIPLTIVSVLAMMEGGYMGIWYYQLASYAGWQVLLDLVVALMLLFTWLIPDAKANGRNPWPWFALTLAAGSFGPLLYLIFGQSGDNSAKAA